MSDKAQWNDKQKSVLWYTVRKQIKRLLGKKLQPSTSQSKCTTAFDPDFVNRNVNQRLAAIEPALKAQCKQSLQTGQNFRSASGLVSHDVNVRANAARHFGFDQTVDFASHSLPTLRRRQRGLRKPSIPVAADDLKTGSASSSLQPMVPAVGAMASLTIVLLDKLWIRMGTSNIAAMDYTVDENLLALKRLLDLETSASTAKRIKLNSEAVPFFPWLQTEDDHVFQLSTHDAGHQVVSQQQIIDSDDEAIAVVSNSYDEEPKLCRTSPGPIGRTFFKDLPVDCVRRILEGLPSSVRCNVVHILPRQLQGHAVLSRFIRTKQVDVALVDDCQTSVGNRALVPGSSSDGSPWTTGSAGFAKTNVKAQADNSVSAHSKWAWLADLSDSDSEAERKEIAKTAVDDVTQMTVKQQAAVLEKRRQINAKFAKRK